MKNKAGVIIGFILGATSFLFLFKLLFLDHIPPEDELAPGVVMMAAILNGLLFGFMGSRVQNYFMKRSQS